MNARYANYVKESGHRPPDEENLWGEAVWQGNRYPLEKANHPFVGVSWDQMTLGVREVCTQRPADGPQWKKPARGPNEYVYP